MKKDSRYIWYAIDIIVFLGLNFLILRAISINYTDVLLNLSWQALFILGLGVYRLTDIITQEGVTDVIRAPFMDKVTAEGKESWQSAKHGFRGFWAILLSCNSCMGVWVSMIVFYSYIFFGTPALIFMIIMSLTGLERFFSKLENAMAKMGNHA